MDGTKSRHVCRYTFSGWLNIEIDQFGLMGFDLSGFDALRHIDAGLREEISAMNFSFSLVDSTLSNNSI